VIGARYKGEFHMPPSSQDKLTIHVNVDITAAALQTIVSYAKQLARQNENGTLSIDTADQVSEMISRFLDEKDFENYVKKIANG
jgi:ribosome maturation factor RimP